MHKQQTTWRVQKAISVGCSDGVETFFLRQRHWPRQVSRHETSRDMSDLVETRLRHSENLRDVRHCQDAGVRT